MNIKDSLRLKSRIGLVAVIVVMLHIAIASIVVFSPQGSLRGYKIITVYKQLIVVGPFFTESRIKTSHYLAVRYKREGNWSSEREYGKEYFLSYTRRPWRFDKLSYNDYEKRLCYEVGKFSENKTFEQVKSNSDFLELNNFLLNEYIKMPVDSLSITYALNEYIPKINSHNLDTVFRYTYNPNTLDEARKQY